MHGLLQALALLSVTTLLIANIRLHFLDVLLGEIIHVGQPLMALP